MQHDSHPYEKVKFHTARIMIPTYKVSTSICKISTKVNLSIRIYFDTNYSNTLQEPLEVVTGTIHEAIHMVLPQDLNCHVYVLDDGKREALERWVLSKRTKRFVGANNIYLKV